MRNYRKIINLFLLVIFLLQLYCTVIILKNPLVGITVKQDIDQRWVIEEVLADGWGASVPLVEKTEVTKINGLDIPSNDRNSMHIMQAENITISHDGESEILVVSYQGLTAQMIKHLLMPLIYIFITSVLCLHLVQRPLVKSKRYLIFHLQFTALAYISAGAAGRGDFLGNTIISLAIFISLVYCIYYCNCFLKTFNEVMVTRLNRLFIFIGTALIMMNIIRIWYKDLLIFQIWIELFLYLTLSAFLAINIIVSFKNNSRFYAKSLFSIFFLGTGPSVLFYAIPTLINYPPILSAEVTAVFLLIVPICLATIELGESSINFPFALNRLFSQLKLILPFNLIVSLILLLLAENRTFQLYSIYFLVIFIASVTLLTYKEWRELKNAHFMTTLKDYNFKHFYKFIQSSRHYPSYQTLIEYIKNELYIMLKVNQIEIVEYRNDERINYLNQQQFQVVCPGLIYKNETYYVFILHESVDSHLLAILDKSFERVESESLKIVEMFLYFVQNIIEQSIKIDDLVGKLSSMDNLHSPNWYRKLLVSSSERERLRISTEIHDTILQDLIRYNRNLEDVMLSLTDVQDRQRVSLLREEMLDVIDTTRDICVSLYPPLIEQMGLYQSLQELLAKYKLRYDFLIEDTIEEINYLSIQQQTAIYRIIQELLSNADKHSAASCAYISLKTENQQIFLDYRDDGIGFVELPENEEVRSLGLIGMQERVQYYRGTFIIRKNVPQGIIINIVMEIGEDFENNGFR